MTAPAAEWDAFISHASEDKTAFVAPLARALTDFGARIWYDEFTLRIGDSLSRSIDRGLAGSRFGIVVLSPSFLNKPWPEYELRGLVSREIGSDKVILPIWHNVSRDDIVRFSPTLADKFAIASTGDDPALIALQLLEVIRPDIYEALYRRAVFDEQVRNAETRMVAPATLHPGPIAHEELPQSMLLRIKLIQRVLFEVMPQPLRETIDNFRRDVRPDRELFIWEAIAAAFIDATHGRLLSVDQRKEIFRALLAASMGTRLQNPRYFGEPDLDRLEALFRAVVPQIEADDTFPLEW